MPKSRTRQDGEAASSEADSAPTGRAAIHGTHVDYGDRVALRAYELYLSRGRADGRDFDDWLAAERELTNNRQDTPRE